MSTLKDVANEADVSIASVSRYLNNNQSVRRETGDKIEAAIKKLDYCIDSAAQSLKTGRFYRIGIISPATGPHYLEIISSIENTLADSNYTTNIFFTRDPKFGLAQKEVPAKMKNVDGTIIMPLNRKSDRAFIKDLKRRGEPFVILDGGKDFPDEAYHQISIDNYGIGKKAAEVLTEAGHTRFLYIKGSDDLFISRDREAGFCRTLEEKGIRMSPERIIPGTFNAQVTLEYIEEHFKTLPDFTAIFAANDLSALGAVKALQKQGRKPMEDYSIIGVDDIDVLPYLSFGLCTFRQPLQTAGLIAANMMIALIEGVSIREKQVMLQAQYIMRESVVSTNFM
ncbi:MAG: LacI family DNA-binding transcriptional regulator [Spirochaetales bacterium]|nr:LacI family DNA-binding transcriptional regulator [Spirochaetales bacterium]